MTKKCTKCNLMLENILFSKQSRGKFGTKSICKSCMRNYYKEWKDINKSSKIEYNKKWRNDNNYKIQMYDNNNKHKKHDAYLRRTYNITFDKKKYMCEQQNYQCYICKSELNKNIISNHVDHNHTTNKVRKILCNNCNHILSGSKKDNDVELYILDNSINYLNNCITEFKYYSGWKYKNKSKFNLLLSNCNNKCQICNIEFKHIIPQIDHDHTTRLIRGLLCRNCNLRLGNCKENISILERSKWYLTINN